MSATVALEQGVLQGTVTDDDRVRTFLGVPYAAPPVGALRWAPPRPHGGWTGERAAIAHGAIAPQPPMVPTSLYASLPRAQSEDCLSVNVWTGPDGDRDRPVLVWFHMGALQFGSGSEPVYDGASLARHGVTVVNVNYRLGRLGFLAHPELRDESEHGACGNYGLMDQAAALRWVQENIRAFGGDPDNVTISGCSAGAHSVYCLMSSPLTKGLFHRAIAQSGVGFTHAITGPGHPSAMQTLDAGMEAGVEFAAALGASSLAELRAASPEEILNVHLDRASGPWNMAFLPPGVSVGDAGFDSGYPVIDGYVLPRPPREVFAAGDQHDVPLIAGSTLNESSGLPFISTADVYQQMLDDVYGDMADEIRGHYPVASDSETPRMSGQLQADRVFTWATWTAARLHGKTATSPTYYYRFVHEPPLPRADAEEIAERDNARAFHGADVLYVFGTLGARRWPWTDGDHELAATMSQQWLAFARSGDPNQDGLPEWSRFTPENPSVLVIDTESHQGTGPEDPVAMGLWDRYYSAWTGS